MVLPCEQYKITAASDTTSIRLWQKQTTPPPLPHSLEPDCCTVAVKGVQATQALCVSQILLHYTALWYDSPVMLPLVAY